MFLQIPLYKAGGAHPGTDAHCRQWSLHPQDGDILLVSKRMPECIMDIQIVIGFVLSTLKARVHIQKLGIHLRVYLVDESPPALSLAGTAL